MTPKLVIEPARLAGSSLLQCQTDDRLVDLVRAGNDRAFEAIVDRYRQPLLRYCGRFLPPARAEDVVQQALLNAYSGLQRSNDRIDLRPWLYRIAHNAALNALRENGWGHEPIEGAAIHVLPTGESAHDVAERRTSLRAVLEAVQMLPERQRDAVILRELEGRTYEQIAAELESSDGAVRQLLNRARHTLRAAASALTPAGLFGRLPWAQSGSVAAHLSQTAANEPARASLARVAGAIAAGVAVTAGLAEAPRQLPALIGSDPSPHATHAPDAAASSSQAAGAATRSTGPSLAASAAGLAASAAAPARPAIRHVNAAPKLRHAHAKRTRAGGTRIASAPAAQPTTATQAVTQQTRRTQATRPVQHASSHHSGQTRRHASSGARSGRSARSAGAGTGQSHRRQRGASQAGSTHAARHSTRAPRAGRAAANRTTSTHSSRQSRTHQPGAESAEAGRLSGRSR